MVWNKEKPLHHGLLPFTLLIKPLTFKGNNSKTHENKYEEALHCVVWPDRWLFLTGFSGLELRAAEVTWLTAAKQVGQWTVCNFFYSPWVRHVWRRWKVEILLMTTKMTAIFVKGVHIKLHGAEEVGQPK